MNEAQGELKPKTFKIQNNIGKSKYVVTIYDGIAKNKDGSPFCPIAIFNNKKFLNSFTKQLKSDGYKEN